jgi:ribonuclease HI
MSARNEAQEPEVIIYTDGACKGNPGRAAGGADDLGDHRRELHGGETMTTITAWN